MENSINDILTAEEAVKGDRIRECIDYIAELKEVSPFKDLMEHTDVVTRYSAKNAELGRQGAYALILSVLKTKLLNEEPEL